MLVFWDQRLVFLATPKTGSTAIAAALAPLAAVSVQRPPVLKHTPVQRYHRFIGPYLKAASGAEFTTVALMRAPRDWLGSWYRFRRRVDLPDPRMSTKDMSFDDFARAYASDPRPEVANVGSQARFLAPRGRPGVDRIFRYDRMAEFLAFMEAQLGQALVLPVTNVSPDAPLILTPGTAADLDAAQHDDLALYASLG